MAPEHQQFHCSTLTDQAAISASTRALGRHGTGAGSGSKRPPHHRPPFGQGTPDQIEGTTMEASNSTRRQRPRVRKKAVGTERGPGHGDRAAVVGRAETAGGRDEPCRRRTVADLGVAGQTPPPAPRAARRGRRPRRRRPRRDRLLRPRRDRAWEGATASESSGRERRG